VTGITHRLWLFWGSNAPPYYLAKKLVILFGSLLVINLMWRSALGLAQAVRLANAYRRANKPDPGLFFAAPVRAAQKSSFPGQLNRRIGRC